MTLLAAALLLGCTRGGPDDTAPTDTTGGDSTLPVDDTDPPDSTPPDDTDPPVYEEYEVQIITPSTTDQFVECLEICASARFLNYGQPMSGVTGQLEIEGHGVFGTGESGTDGSIAFCTSGVELGTANLAATFYLDGEKYFGYSTFEVVGFGYGFGLERADALTELPAIPVFERHDGNPLITAGDEGEWDSEGDLLPTVVTDGSTYTMYFSGTPASDYQIGGATSPDGLSWTKMSGNPVLAALGDGSWRGYATNSPTALYDEGLYKVWFNGRQEDGSGLSIGLATSEDGEVFTEVDGNPLLEPEEDWENQAVAHPTVVRTGDVYEMWYASSTLQLGYALSEDGVSWTKYCHNPVFSGVDGTWDEGEIKSPEVIWDGAHYLMTYAGGGEGNWSVGWAMSTDGITWVRADEPVMTSDDDDVEFFETLSVIGAPMILDGDTLQVWYSGTSASGSAIGHATADWSSK